MKEQDKRETQEIRETGNGNAGKVGEAISLASLAEMGNAFRRNRHDHCAHTTPEQEVVALQEAARNGNGLAFNELIEIISYNYLVPLAEREAAVFALTGNVWPSWQSGILVCSRLLSSNNDSNNPEQRCDLKDMLAQCGMPEAMLRLGVLQYLDSEHEWKATLTAAAESFPFANEVLALIHKIAEADARVASISTANSAIVAALRVKLSDSEVASIRLSAEARQLSAEVTTARAETAVLRASATVSANRLREEAIRTLQSEVAGYKKRQAEDRKTMSRQAQTLQRYETILRQHGIDANTGIAHTAGHPRRKAA